MKKLLAILLLCIAAIALTTGEAYAYRKVTVWQGMDLVKVFAGKDMKFVIKEDIDLDGKTVKMGEGCMLAFNGGSLANGKVVGNKTKVKAPNYEIFKRGYTRYRAYIEKGATKGCPPSLQKVYHNCIVLEGSWMNKKCGTKWTGLLNDSNEDVMLAVKNYVMLHDDGAKVTFPSFNALGYETTKLPGNHCIDFNKSKISYPDNLNIWEDNTIAVPEGSKSCEMESGYGIITTNSNTTILNLSIDGKSTFRQNEALRLGVSCIVCIGNAKNVVLDNVSISNVMGPALVAHPKSENITFRNCFFYNIGEHVMYSQQYLGFCHFEGCTFDTWDSERLSVHRNGLNYVYKHTPLFESGDIPFDDIYRFDLTFSNCHFNNPKRVTSQNRTLGGFLTGTFPIVVNVNNCKFSGVFPMLNPGGGSTISEKTGKCFKMVVRGCDGAPYVYASKSNYNIIAEFYDCKNIPFRTVYAKRYENCELFIDIYEDDNEGVSSSFKNEFSEPLIVKHCEFVDRGTNVIINHPLIHRSISFENCKFKSSANRGFVSEVLTIKSDAIKSVSFRFCEFNLPKFRVVGGSKVVNDVQLNNCIFRNIEQKYVIVNARKLDINNNVFE